jgi:tetratricopeptide (TPR) repeat protein
VCVLVIGAYVYLSQSGLLELLSPNPASTYYNLLVQGFRAGQLSLKVDVPPGLTQLADPYDPTANAPYRLMPYRLHDMSFYKGRLYLYHGVTPALMLFWPVVAVTGKYLLHRQAVVIFCAIGFLASMGLLHALWRRYFTEVSIWVVAACALALGLATGMPILLSQADVYQVPICCGYMLTMLALAAIWCALHEPERRGRWLVIASVIYGLAMGARPSLLLGAVILLVPVGEALRERRNIVVLLVAAIAPIFLIGLALMLYNYQRFDNPFEFGLRYQLNGQVTRHFFDLHDVWFNFRVYFLGAPRWSRQFPFVQAMAAPPLPPGHSNVEGTFGILMNTPIVWLALAAPLAWRNRTSEAGSILRWFVTAVALLFGIGALTIHLYHYTSVRYEVEFLPSLLLLTVIGILGLERTLADQPTRRRVIHWTLGVLLGLSVAFNLLASIEYHAEAHHVLGVQLSQSGKPAEAVGQFEQALRLYPNYPKAHLNLGIALEQLGHRDDAIYQYQQALLLSPDYAKAHLSLAVALEHTGKIQDAIQHYQEALRINPDLTDSQSALARLKAGQ